MTCCNQWYRGLRPQLWRGPRDSLTAGSQSCYQGKLFAQWLIQRGLIHPCIYQDRIRHRWIHLFGIYVSFPASSLIYSLDWPFRRSAYFGW